MIRSVLAGIFALLCASVASAADVNIGTVIACKPFVNADGTQVLETYARNREECKSSHTSFLVRFADFKEGVLCSYTGNMCVRYADLGQDARARYDALRIVHEKADAPRFKCPARSDGATFRSEMVPAATGFGCGMNVSAVRHYDLILGTVSFLDGKGKVIGAIRVEPARLHEVIASATY